MRINFIKVIYTIFLILVTACGSNDGNSIQSENSYVNIESSENNSNSSLQISENLIESTPLPATGNTYFIGEDGSDNNDGSQSSPWQTLQQAANTVVAGDTIVVNQGTYPGARFSQSGTPTEWISLRAAEGATVIIDGPGSENRHDSTLEFENWDDDEIISYWLVEGLEVTGASYWGIDIRGNETNHSHHFIIRNNIVYDNGWEEGKTGIFFAFIDDVIVEGNESFSNGEHGIYLSNSGDRFLISGNTLYENNNCGIHINGDLESGEDGIISDGIVEKNVIFDNGEGGCAAINMDGVTDSIIRNNLLFDNHGSGIALFQENGAVCTQNIQVLNNTILQADDGRWALIIMGDDCINNKIFNNIILTTHEWRGSIVIPTTGIEGFESDNNIIMNRFSADDDDSVISLTEWQSLGYDQNSIVASPEDVFISESDYHLNQDSPAIDAGKLLENISIDIEFTPRPHNDATDIGAYEFTSINAEILTPTPIVTVEDSSDIVKDGGKITYFFDGNAYMVAAEEGATPINISTALDQISPGGDDGLVNISPDGEWLILDTERFDSECIDWACLTIVSADLSTGEIIRSENEIIRGEGISAIASGGDLVVFAYGEGPNDFDLWSVSRNGNDWNSPILLTGDSPFASNFQMSISADGNSVLFNCGTDPYGGDDTSICEVGTDGNGFRVILSPDDIPPGFTSNGGFYQPDYSPDGNVIFEANWGSEQIWRLPSGTTTPELIAGQFSNDNSPCVLPDGRIVSLWLDRDGGDGFHEIKIMASDGSSFFMMLPNLDIVDAGMGCGS